MPGLFLGRPGTQGRTGSVLGMDTGSRSADRGGCPGRIRPVAERWAAAGGWRGTPRLALPGARSRQWRRSASGGWSGEERRLPPRRAGPRFRRAGAGRGAPGVRGASERFRLVRGAATAEQGAELRCPEAGAKAAGRRRRRRGVRQAAAKGWRGERERGATADLTTEPGHRSAGTRERPGQRARRAPAGGGAQAYAPSAPTPPPPSSPHLSLLFCAPAPGATRSSSCRERCPLRRRIGPGPGGWHCWTWPLEGMAVFGFVLFLVLWLMHFGVIYTWVRAAGGPAAVQASRDDEGRNFAGEMGSDGGGDSQFSDSPSQSL